MTKCGICELHWNSHKHIRGRGPKVELLGAKQNLDWITNLVLKEYGKLRTDTAFFAYYSGKLFQQHTRVTGTGCQLVNMVRSRLADRFDCGSCSELRFIGYLFICLFLSLFIWDSEWGEDKGLHPLILSPNVGVTSRSEPGAKGGKAFQVFPMGGRNPTT